jgi:hypothetical protein
MSVPRVLVVRAKPHGFDREAEFMNGLISIGWPVGCSFEGKNRSQIGDFLDSIGLRTELAISQIQNFVSLPSGSIILNPSIQSRKVHVFVESGPYFYRQELEKEPKTGEAFGNPHTIQAKYLRSLPRTSFPDIVQRALNAARKTVTRFDKYAESIHSVINQESDQSGQLASSGSSEIKKEVIDSLRELLKSPKEETRLKAALALKDLI